MKLQRCLGFALFLITVLSAFQEKQGFQWLAGYKQTARIIAADNFGNFYAAANNKLQKYNAEGKFLYPYEEFRYGKIGALDVSNPLKILVFFPDFSTAVTLDRFLAPLNTYNFFEMGYQQVTAVASSADGRIWFYDNRDFRLKKIDEFGKIYRESQQLSVLAGTAPQPNFMLERDNRVYVNDPELGILVFDIFGSYAKTVPLLGLERFQVEQDQIIYFQDRQFKAYNPLTLETRAISLPDSQTLKAAAIQKNTLAILKADSLLFYRY